MTRKDYILIAQTLRGQRPYRSATDAKTDTDRLICAVWDLVVKDMADALSKDNPKFDHKQFVEACGLIGTVVRRGGTTYESNPATPSPRKAKYLGEEGQFFVFEDEKGNTYHLTGYQLSPAVRGYLSIEKMTGFNVTLVYRTIRNSEWGWYVSEVVS
jgi:hypothetical protein